MTADNSVTHWFGQLQQGDNDAAQRLWERYFERLTALAKSKLRGRTLAASDEEDVALSAFNSFCRAASQGRYPQLADRDNLWRLLVVITAHKALHQVRDQGRKKRGGKHVIVGDLGGFNGESPAIEQIIGREPSPEFVVMVTEEYQRLLDCLGNQELASLAVWRMEGYTNEEIATRLSCSPRTIERKLRLIRGIWEKESSS